jgi:hypothetical protein
MFWGATALCVLLPALRMCCCGGRAKSRTGRAKTRTTRVPSRVLDGGNALRSPSRSPEPLRRTTSRSDSVKQRAARATQSQG